MPTYEYKCSACDHVFEKFQSITAAPIKKCPQCGKSKVKRMIGTGAGLIFKGSGFYITDYRDKSYTEKAKADSGTAPAASTDGKASGDGKAAATETKSDSKATKAESKPAAAAPAKSESKPASKKK